jgi:hypothetical protein
VRIIKIITSSELSGIFILIIDAIVNGFSERNGLFVLTRYGSNRKKRRGGFVLAALLFLSRRRMKKNLFTINTLASRQGFGCGEKFGNFFEWMSGSVVVGRRSGAFGGGRFDESAGDAAFSEEFASGEDLEAVLAGVREDYALEVHGKGDVLADVLEFDEALLLEDDFFVFFDIYEADFGLGFSVAVCHFAEEDDLPVACRVAWGVYGLDDVDDAGHS